MKLQNESGAENIVPLSFQAALFKDQFEQAASEKAEAEIGSSKDALTGPAGSKLLRLPLLPIQPGNDTLPGKPQQQVLSLATPAHDLLVPHSSMEHNDLSVIAEDDEPSERGRLSTYDHMKNVCMSTPPPASAVAGQMYHRSPEAALNISIHDANMSSTTSRDTFHSIPLDSPVVSGMAETLPKEMFPISADKPQAPATHEEAVSHAGTQFSNEEAEDFAMADIQEEFVSLDPKLIEKPSVMAFPTLPEPMPLRKSIRHPRDPSTITAMLGAATPGLPAGGKRTSWLIKAREVKALEVTTKKPFDQPMNVYPAARSPAPHGTKRKSEDLPAIPHFEPGDGERQPKVLKVTEGETAPRKSKVPRETAQEELMATRSPQTQHVHEMQEPGQEGVLDRLKKTVEGLGARVNKTMGRSLGGGTATALAEARAAAEAKVAERDRKEEEMTMAIEAPYGKDPRSTSSQATDTTKSLTLQNEGRLSISDLFPMDGRVKEKHKAPEKSLQYTHGVPLQNKVPLDRESTSTTPPNSPPPADPILVASAPVFNKPHPVFIPPQPAAKKSKTPPLAQFSAFEAPSAPKGTTPMSMALGFSPRLSSKSSPRAKITASLTAHSTLESVQSDQLFEHHDAPTWMHGTQDTEYTTGYETQSQPQNPQVCNEDDSWSVDEKLAAGVQWTFSGSKEDSMTWSTLPSQSQRGDTGPVIKSPVREIRDKRDSTSTSHQIPGAFDAKMLEEAEDEAALPHDAELEEIILGGNSEVSLPFFFCL